jgi:hypothetical protein
MMRTSQPPRPGLTDEEGRVKRLSTPTDSDFSVAWALPGNAICPDAQGEGQDGSGAAADGCDDPAMHDRERRRIENGSPATPAHRAPSPEHLLLALQRTAGNAAVAGLVAGATVQRYLPSEGPDEGPAGPELLPDPTIPVQWMASVQPGGFSVVPGTPSRVLEEGIWRPSPPAMVEASRERVAEWATSLPYEAIPSTVRRQPPGP